MSRLRLDLSARMTEEDRLIQRILDLPKGRREEYVRSLLLKGFQLESEASDRDGQGPREQRRHVDTDTETKSDIATPTSEAKPAPQLPVTVTLQSLKDVVG